MSNELFDQLEQKVSNTLDTVELLRMEVEELRAENQRLLNERQQGESRLNGILARFSQLEPQAHSAPAAYGQEPQPHQEAAPPSEHQHY